MFVWLKKIYVYIFSAVGLILIIVGGVQLVNLALKTWVFTKADIYYEYPASKIISEQGQKEVQPKPEELAEYRKNDLASRRQRQAANALAAIAIGLPVFIYHWKLAVKEREA